MTRVTTDASELRTLAADMRAVPERLTRHVYPVVAKGALNVKTAMVADAEASPHFKGIARSIGFDIHQTSFAGDGVLEAEVGPSSAAGSPGNLANIAYFGTSRGGGTVRDPQAALDDEAPKFERALGDLLDDLL